MYIITYLLTYLSDKCLDTVGERLEYLGYHNLGVCSWFVARCSGVDVRGYSRAGSMLTCWPHLPHP